MDSSKVFSFRQMVEMESMNHLSMDVEDGQALIKKVALKCPKCESTNTKFSYYQNQQESHPCHYCNDCRQSWIVDGELRDIPVGEGQGKRPQPDNSAPDHARVGLKCPRCESTNTKFAYYQNRDKSKPRHFCHDCKRQWTVGGKLFVCEGGRKRLQPESSMANQASMSQVALKCPRCESMNTKFSYNQHGDKSKPCHFCDDCRRQWSVGGRQNAYGARKKRLKPESSMTNQASMSQVALKCPRCESTNMKFAYYQDQKRSKPVHFRNNCLHYWTVGERKIQQPETSMANQASMCQVALKCPRCESINTKFVYYQHQNGSKPVHFCKDCRRHWTVGALLRTRLYNGGKRRRRQLKDPGLRASVEGPDSQAASKETTEVVQTKCTQETEHQNLSSCLLESNVKDNRGHEKTRQSDGSGEMASDGGQEKTRQSEGSGKIASVGGFESNVASNEALEVIHTECSKSFSCSAQEHQPVSLCLEKFSSHLEKDSEGFHFDNEVTPNEEVNLSDASRSPESPESSNVVENSSWVKKCNTFNDFCINARENQMAQHISVYVATATSRQPSPEPSPLESGFPFIKSSFMWPQFGSMEVFRSMPQQPHFNPLKEQDEYLREGAAIGLMLSFTKLVEVTRKAQLEDSRSMFDVKLDALQLIEGYGFTVEPIRTQLVKLLQIKESYEQHNCMLKTTNKEVTEGLESIALLDKDIQMLKEKKEIEAIKVAELQRTSDKFKENILEARFNFATMVADPW